MYNNLYQQQLPYQQQMPQQQRMMPMPQALKGRPVSSLEEARATVIDFDGSMFFFPDIANKRIYTKQINMDGTATLCVYELTNVPVEQNEYITRMEFDKVMQQIKSLLENKESKQSTQQSNQTQSYEFK